MECNSTAGLPRGAEVTCTITNTRRGVRSQPFTPGHWKTHQAETTALLPIMLGNYLVTTWKSASAILVAMNCGSSKDQDAVGCLAGHLLSAELNVKDGANNCINPVIAQADALLVSIGYAGPGRGTR